MRFALTIGVAVILVACGAGGFSASSWGASAEAEKSGGALAIRFGVHPNFDRIAIDKPSGVRHEVKRDGAALSVEFFSPISFNERSFSSSKLGRIKYKSSLEGGKILLFNVSPQATIKDSAAGRTIVIDVFGPPASEAAIPAAISVAPVAPENTAKKPVQEKTAKALSQPAKDMADANKNPPESEAEPFPVLDALAPAPSSAVIVDAPLSGDKAAVGGGDPSPVKLKAEEQHQVLTATPNPTVVLPLRQAARNLEGFPEIGFSHEMLLSLDPKMAVGLAAFVRGGYCTIIFDRKITMSLEELANGAKIKVKAEVLDLPRNSGYRFAIPNGVFISVGLSGTAWRIMAGRGRVEPYASADLIVQPDYALGARVMLPVSNLPDPVRFNDPVVGDDLIVMPLRQASAFGAARRLTDFEVISSSQGLVIKPFHEKVVMRSISDGAEVTADGGLLLSPSSDTGAQQQSSKRAKLASQGKTLFDFATWRGKPNETFTAARQRLMQTIVDVPEMERNRARLDLARFYFTYGMGNEALSMLFMLARQVPDLATHADFLALRGAARILADHPAEGLNDLEDPEIGYSPEIELWRAVAAARLRDWKTAEEKFNVAEQVLAAYPEPFHSRFQVLSVESAIAMGKDREAAEWLDRMETNPHLDEVYPAIRYLRGVMSVKSGRAESAASLWRETARSRDRLYKIRAELALTDLGVATHSITARQAADRLEGLRFAWRGDDLELDILHRLGSFYIEAGDFKSGLAILSQATRLFPNGELTKQIRAEMETAFRNVFSTDAGKNMPPMEALSLYQEYHDLMPKGAGGDLVGVNLAERLVEVDLLEQAATLLEGLVRTAADPEGKSRMGARLAAIRLLDRNSAAAIAALEMSEMQAMPESLREERILLRARAISEQDKHEDALALLKNDNSVAARTLKADITMRAQKWTDAAAVLRDLAGAPPAAGETLSDEKAQWLVNCAVAMSLSGDTDGLGKLAIDFGAAMAGTQQSDTFRVLTRPEKAVQMRDIAAAQSKMGEVDMFRGFLDKYRSLDK